MLRTSSPSGLFFIKTKANQERMERIARSLKFEHNHFVKLGKVVEVLLFCGRMSVAGRLSIVLIGL